MASPQYDQPMEDYHEEGINPNILEIPLLGEGEAVTLDLVNDLAEDPSELCVLLENEKCGHVYWLAIGVSLYSFEKRVLIIRLLMHETVKWRMLLKSFRKVCKVCIRNAEGNRYLTFQRPFYKMSLIKFHFIRVLFGCIFDRFGRLQIR